MYISEYKGEWKDREEAKLEGAEFLLSLGIETDTKSGDIHQ